jgi:hypothetical protein
VEMQRIDSVRAAALFSVIVMMMLSQGCAGSRFVSQATSRGDTIKFAYTQQKFMSSEQGLIECKVAEDGALSECQRIDVEFQDK